MTHELVFQGVLSHINMHFVLKCYLVLQEDRSHTEIDHLQNACLTAGLVVPTGHPAAFGVDYYYYYYY